MGGDLVCRYCNHKFRIPNFKLRREDVLNIRMKSVLIVTSVVCLSLLTSSCSQNEVDDFNENINDLNQDLNDLQPTLDSLVDDLNSALDELEQSLNS